MFEYTLCHKCQIRKLEARIRELESYVDYLESIVMKYELDGEWSDRVEDPKS